tara:strand:- start:3331 stop:4098 length:768 start_codon:yes stop_codon:yes gene_type:complete
MSYLKPTISRSNSIKIITEAIRNEKPFLFTRFGDGEVWLLMEWINPVRLIRIKKEWLVTDSNYKEVLKRVKNELIECFNNSDMAGIMNENPLEYGVRIAYRPKSWSIPIEVAKNMGMSNKNVTSHLLSRGTELGDPNNFKKILNGKPIHIISPNTEHLIKNNLSKILGCEITYTRITRIPNNVIYDTDILIKELDKIKESIVIFGCGAGGKWIGNYLKTKHGKVCLDFGATLDGWAGKITRKWFADTQKHLVIKK